MSVLDARQLTQFHDSRHALAGWAKSGAAEHPGGLWQAVEALLT